jgi:hypothetical protein
LLTTALLRADRCACVDGVGEKIDCDASAAHAWLLTFVPKVAVPFSLFANALVLLGASAIAMLHSLATSALEGAVAITLALLGLVELVVAGGIDAYIRRSTLDALRTGTVSKHPRQATAQGWRASRSRGADAAGACALRFATGSS